eukprot:scpid15447/ scgid23188/ 
MQLCSFSRCSNPSTTTSVLVKTFMPSANTRPYIELKFIWLVLNVIKVRMKPWTMFTEQRNITNKANTSKRRRKRTRWSTPARNPAIVNAPWTTYYANWNTRTAQRPFEPHQAVCNKKLNLLHICTTFDLSFFLSNSHPARNPAI